MELLKLFEKLSASAGAKQDDSIQATTSEDVEEANQDGMIQISPENLKDVLQAMAHLLAMAMFTQNGTSLNSSWGTAVLFDVLNDRVAGMDSSLNKAFPSLRTHIGEIQKMAFEIVDNAEAKADAILAQKRNEMNLQLEAIQACSLSVLGEEDLSSYGEEHDSGSGYDSEGDDLVPSKLFCEDVGEEVRSINDGQQASQMRSVARAGAVSSLDSPSTCERYAEAEELDNPDQGSAALSAIPSPNATVPPPLSEATVLAEDRDEVKDDELSQERLSSFLARIQDGEGIIAVETNLNQVARAAVERIFDPWQPQYKCLTVLANDVITVLTCNDKASKNLFLEHSGKADMAASNVIGLGTGVAWGDIAFEAARKASDKEIADLPDGITSFLEGAREAVSLLDNPRAKKLGTFVKLWDVEKFQLGNLVSLAIMQMALYKLTLEAVTSDKGSTLELRNNVEALWTKVLPGVDFDAAERLSVILTVLVRPGLNSTDETIFVLSCDVLLGTIKILTFKAGTETEHLEIQNAYNDSQSYTAAGKIVKSKKDYGSQPRERNRMVTLYFVHYVHDLLVRRKLSQVTTGKSLLSKLLITGPDRIRNAFDQSMFNMSKDVTKAQLTKIRDLLKAEKQERSNESKMLLIDSEEQINSLQNILQIAANDP